MEDVRINEKEKLRKKKSTRICTAAGTGINICCLLAVKVNFHFVLLFETRELEKRASHIEFDTMAIDYGSECVSSPVKWGKRGEVCVWNLLRNELFQIMQ